MARRGAQRILNATLASFVSSPSAFRVKTKTVGYRNQKGGFVGYKHALSAVRCGRGCRAVLAGHGLSQDVTQNKDWISVRVHPRHAAGHGESVEMGGPPDNSGKEERHPANRQHGQLPGSAATLKAITGVTPKRTTTTWVSGDGNPDAAVTCYAIANLSAWSELIRRAKSADQIIASVVESWRTHDRDQQ